MHFAVNISTHDLDVIAGILFILAGVFNLMAALASEIVDVFNIFSQRRFFNYLWIVGLVSLVVGILFLV